MMCTAFHWSIKMYTGLTLVNLNVYWSDIGNLVSVLANQWSFVLYDVFSYRHTKTLHSNEVGSVETYFLKILKMDS